MGNKSNNMKQSDEFVEKVVCNVNELPNNGMKVFDMNPGKVLLVKEGNDIYAIGDKCPHYGAPLVKGCLHNGKVRCPWHGASFNVKTGDIEEFPTAYNVPVYKVEVDDNKVKIKAKKSDLEKNKVVKSFETKNDLTNETYVIVGGGFAGFQCATTLREEGFGGRVILVCGEELLPYDRTKASKLLKSEAKDIVLRPAEFYESANIETKLNVKVTNLDALNKSLTLNNDERINYDKVFIAPGLQPRKFTVPGSDLKNVCYVRNYADGAYIADAAVGKNVVVLGTSWIGMEVAAYVVKDASSVSVVGRSTPFKESLGEKIGNQIKTLFESKNVKFHLGTNIKECLGDDGSIKEVVLQNGATLPADVLVIGIGAEPSLSFLSECGINLDKQNYIVVDEYFKTSMENVFAGGDIVSFPISIVGETYPASIGHWSTAQDHGRHAALSMLGKGKPTTAIPFFWSLFFWKGVHFAGHCIKYDDIVFHGDLEKLDFIAFYIRDSKVVGVCCSGSKDPAATAFATLIQDGKLLYLSDIETNPVGWMNFNDQ